MEMRLQRFLSQAGVASRRHAEELIVAGKVTVNGRVVRELGSKVDSVHDKVTVDGWRVQVAALRYVVLCKPRGHVTTVSDPQGRATVMELLGAAGKGLFPVGRLDYNTDGVLLLTNDGDLAHGLMHPSKGVPKTYHAKVTGAVSEEVLQQLRKGVVLDDGDKTAPAEVMLVTPGEKHCWLQITIREGKNRQVHRMCDAVGCDVLRLSRVAYGPVSSEGLRPGEWRDLSASELEALRVLAGLIAPVAKPSSKASAKPSGKAGGKAGGKASGKAESRRPQAPNLDEEEEKPRVHRPAMPRRRTGPDPRGPATSAPSRPTNRPTAAPRTPSPARATAERRPSPTAGARPTAAGRRPAPAVGARPESAPDRRAPRGPRKPSSRPPRS